MNIKIAVVSLGVFSKILMRWDNFLIHLKTILSKGQIITAELFKNSMPYESYLEYLSIERFKVFCKKYGWNIERNLDNSFATDLFVDEFKVQMKYHSNLSIGKFLSYWINTYYRF